MKRTLATLLALLTLASVSAACGNEGDLIGLPEDPVEEESPNPTPVETPEPDPDPDPTPPLPPEADLAITLLWDDLGLDWELHLVRPGGTINDTVTYTDCTWNTCIYYTPDWGVQGDTSDDPHKDIDDLDQYGPERIWQAEPENGIFHIFVEHWGTGSSDSDGYVKLWVGGAEYEFVQNDVASMDVWLVATVEYPGGIVTELGEVYDCSANWSSGCRDPLPLP